MTPHCKGCKHHHNAGHAQLDNRARTFNDWCCKYSGRAADKVGHCKLNNGKESK
jgi:hypothetical protein